MDRILSPDIKNALKLNNNFFHIKTVHGTDCRLLMHTACSQCHYVSEMLAVSNDEARSNNCKWRGKWFGVQYPLQYND